MTAKGRAGSAAPLAVALAAATIAVFARAATFDFLDYDDPEYVTRNARVLSGLSWEGARWAFGATYQGNWMPLTWLSHMLDAELFGGAAAGHHLTSVVVHAASAALLFLALQRMTRATWRSALVAALFAMHPLRAESVAWVAERKDVLSTCFFMASLLAYAAYAERPRAWRMALVAAFSALGLLCKQTYVTLPFVLLLLDVWPLRRLSRPSLPRLVAEKLPLFALAAAGCLAALRAQRTAMPESLPLAARLPTAALTYAHYLRRELLPTDLAIFRPHPYVMGHVPSHASVALAVAVLAALSALALAQLRARPYLFVGWCWYLGTWVPMVGLVQVGIAQAADRFTYVPLVGPVLAAVWLAADAVEARPRWRVPGAGLAAACVLASAAATWVEVGHYRDSRTVFARALEVTDDNWVAETNLGVALLDAGDAEGALAHFRSGQRISPGDTTMPPRIGRALAALGRYDESIAAFEEAMRMDPGNADAQTAMCTSVAALGRLGDAARCLRKAIALDPAQPGPHRNLAVVERMLGDAAGAAHEDAEAERCASARRVR